MPTKAATLADWLDEIGSHDIYDADILFELKPFGIIVRPDDKGWFLKRGDKSVRTSVRSARIMRREGKQDYKGPHLAEDVDDDAPLIGGHEITAALRRLFEVETHHFYGRGSQHRADVAAIKAIL